ncbi:MAG TPA: 50S ribosomal protein L6 [Hyphomicrobium sp.]|nr:50S ribosomal protein L6 [Hyphomicrobium sp.]
MSRIGKKPVPVPSNVTATVAGQNVKMKGPKGELSFNVPEELKVEKTDEGVLVSLIEDTKPARSMWGTSRTQIANLIKGVTDGYSHDLEIHGVGFKASMKGKNEIVLSVGYSHDVVLTIPAGVDVKVGGAKQDLVTVSGIDKQVVGQMAAEIRASRKPEPYQGKGVRYKGEYIFRKEGKKK